ncbi:hypothetical protein PF005_g30837 [Phytophthora fragariae]|uniref:HTH CENPB-type domain-containing protein n=1 Tax=Phytophthora fragariae TaxID=53985 RepID=A0A6A3TTI4_9STRA|nr:hypothetical protein PF003_g38547 [Phytophthora fragariae]KAE8924945.1 hypothetical protein PF009_g24832 [Phytophthora fragariae]KAE8960590.1 hypothetical protein PF011_g30040 [Phytophthora fragariae]KAE9077149.1 hypothetical protein PF007_g24357 [Phytophthora fragariae]KAE9141829.1 hypothetical protein PF006_g13018 [Phytophthora fragariae]
MSEAYGDDKRRKPLEVTSLALEQKLWAWIQCVEAQNVCLSRELIRMKAQDLQKELCDAWDLKFSDGWLSGFERRHALRCRQRHGEAASADSAAVYLGRQQLQDLTDEYAPQDIYNMDETGLCYAMAPARSICTRGACGVKKNKTRITLALTTNADGSDALPPLFLGRAKKPYCFKKRTAAQLGFNYRANQKAWMTGHLFREWLLNLDRDMRASGRHILLLVDNASSHNSDELVCTNVRLEFLSPNTTAFLQPMDAGIIAAFKRGYRRKQLRWVYDKIKRGEEIKSSNVYKVDQLQAMSWSKEIWQELQSKDTIENCFRHTGIVFNGVDERSKEETSYRQDVDVEDIIIRAAELSL